MAEKRRIEISGQGQNEEQEKEELPRKFKDISWREWFKVDFARYCFVALVLAIDILFGLEVMRIFPEVGSLGFAIFLAITVPLEVLIYLYLWGKKGILMS